VRKNKKFSIPRCFFESEGVVFYGVYYEHRQETLRQIPFTEQYFPGKLYFVTNPDGKPKF